MRLFIGWHFVAKWCIPKKCITSSIKLVFSTSYVMIFSIYLINNVSSTNLVGSIGDLGGVKSLFNSWKLLAFESLSIWFDLDGDLDDLNVEDFFLSLLGILLNFDGSSFLLFLLDEFRDKWTLLFDSAEGGGFAFLADRFVFGVCLITITPFLLAFNITDLELWKAMR